MGFQINSSDAIFLRNQRTIVLRRADLIKLHDYSQKNAPLRDYCLIRVPMKCGLRPGEIRNLKWSQIEFESLTIRVMDSKKHKVRLVPMDPITADYLMQLKGGICPYDIVALIHPPVIEAYPYVRELTEEVKKPEWKWDELVPAVRKQFYYGDKVFAIPVDGVPMVFVYRKDLVTNPEEMAKFEEKYGFKYNIENMTWDDFIKVAEFFTRPEKGLYGASLLGAKEVVWQDFLTIYYSYGGRWFDPETMEPRINSPPALEALRISVNKRLADKLGEANYCLRIKVYPHVVLRENKMMAFAGADRLQEGMRRAFGKPVGLAARVVPGKPIAEVEVKAEGVEAAKEALKVGASKLPTPCAVEVSPIGQAAG